MKAIIIMLAALAALATPAAAGDFGKGDWVTVNTNPSPKEPAMTKTTMSLTKLLEKHDEGDFLRAVAEAVLQLIMETDVEGLFVQGRRVAISM